jgi:Protein of unknown function (DUF2795)
MAIQVTEVQKALKGMDYPASGNELCAYAKQNGADQDIVEALSQLGDQEFEGPNGVMKGLKGDLGGPTKE